MENILYHPVTNTNGLEYTGEERHLFALVTGFMRTKIISVAIENGIFNQLSIRPRSYDYLKDILDLPDRSLKVFLDILINLKLININAKGKYQNTGISSKYLVKGKLSYIGGSFSLFETLYEECGGLMSILKKDGGSKKTYSYLFKDSSELKKEDVEDYTMQMFNTNGHPVMTLTEFYDFEGSRVVIDIGGGTGKICQTLVSQYEDMETILFDLPSVCEIAEEKLKGFWLKHRIKIQAGDFFKDELPDGFDTAVMMRITQDLSLDQIEYLFKKVYDKLPSGGKLIIYEIFKNNAKNPGDESLVSLLLLMNTIVGTCRTIDEISSVLEKVGFADIRSFHTIYIYNAIEAVKP